MALVVWATLSKPFSHNLCETGNHQRAACMCIYHVSISDLVKLIVLQDAKMHNAR
jgi:hypothetical protein